MPTQPGIRRPPPPDARRSLRLLAAGLAGVVCLVAAVVALCSYLPGGGKGLATLHVVAEPEGTQVFLDDRFVGAAPVAVPRLPFGRHVVRLEKHGCQTLRKTVDLRRSEQTLRLTLAPQPTAGISLSSTPPGADVLLDGAYVGRAPITLLDLVPGPHTIAVTKHGFEPWRHEVTLQPNESAAITCQLKSRTTTYLKTRAQERPDDVAALVALAHRAILEGKLDDASEALAQALRLVAARPDHPQARWVREEFRKAYQAEFRYGDARAVAACRAMLERVLLAELQAHPGNVRLRHFLVELLSRARRWGPLAEAIGQGAIHPDSTDPHTLAHCGQALVHTGAPDKALELLVPACRRHRGHWRLAYAAGLAYRRKGDKLHARIKLKQALLHCDDADGQTAIRQALDAL